MKLYIFQPYNWDYCGGVIAVIANSFSEAVDLIIKKDVDETIAMAEKEGDLVTKSIEEVLETRRRYKRKYFARAPEDFEEKRKWDNWLLTNELNVPDENVARIVVDDWNYG